MTSAILTSIAFVALSLALLILAGRLADTLCLDAKLRDRNKDLEFEVRQARDAKYAAEREVERWQLAAMQNIAKKEAAK